MTIVLLYKPEVFYGTAYVLCGIRCCVTSRFCFIQLLWNFHSEKSISKEQL